MTYHKELPLESWIEHKTLSHPFSLHYTRLSESTDCALYSHCHDEMEIFYLTEGSLIFHCGNKAFPLNRGEAVFLPPYAIHYADRIPSENKKCSYYAVVFSSEVLENSLPIYCKRYLRQLSLFRPDDVYIIRSTEENKELLSTIGMIFQYFGKDMSSCELSVIGLLLKCWQELHNSFFSKRSCDRKSASAAEYIQKAGSYIQLHFAEQISLSDIAKSTNVSESYLCHCFKEYTGFTPISYINRVRIAKSCEYIMKSGKSMTEISTLCGYNNISYFNRVFKSIMGTSPMAYKKAVEINQ